MSVENLSGSDDLATPNADVDVNQHQPTDPVNSQVQVSNNQTEGDGESTNRFRQLANKAVANLFNSNSEDEETEDDLPEVKSDDNPDETKDDPKTEENLAEEEKTPEEKETRVNKYKATVAQNEQLTTQINELNTKLERFGGVEGFETLGTVLDAFMNLDGKFEIDGENGEKREVSGKEIVYDFVNELPDRDAVYSDFFLKGMESHANRVFAFNDVLQQEFGLKEGINLNQDQINTVMDYLTAKINTAKSPEDIDKVFKDLQFDVEQMGYNQEEFSSQQEIAKLKAKLDAYENPKANQPQNSAQSADPLEALVKEYEQTLEAEQKHYQAQDELIVKLYDTVAADILAKSGWGIADGDDDTIKTGKQKFADILLGRDNLAQRIRKTEAFQKASGYLKNGNLETSRTGNIQRNNLEIAVRSQITQLLKDLNLYSEETPKTKTTTKPGDFPRGEIVPSKENEKKKTFREIADEARGR